MPKLLGFSGPYAGREIPIQISPLRMGRAEECELVIEHSSVSGHHARISDVNGTWLIEDLGSSNGTTVNGSEIRSHLLKEGDRIALGDVEFGFRLTPVPGGAITDDEQALVRRMPELSATILREAGRVVIGQAETLERLWVCVLAGGPVLLVGPPGIGKENMVATLGQLLRLDSRRIRFTPDLTPADLTGTVLQVAIAETEEKEIQFMPGPIFVNLLLADQMHFAMPKTQEVILEAMREKVILVGGQAYNMDEPFVVVVTQNSGGHDKPSAWADAQKFRFHHCLEAGYPRAADEQIILSTPLAVVPPLLQSVLGRVQLVKLQQVLEKMSIPPLVLQYATRLVRSTRPDDTLAPDFVRKFVRQGVNPRTGQVLLHSAKARALTQGRTQVGCPDVRYAAAFVLPHQLALLHPGTSGECSPGSLVEKLLGAVEEPVGGNRAPSP